MNREIRKAHKALIEQTPDNSLPSIRQNSSSKKQSIGTPSTSRSKMKRSKTSAERPREKKSLKRYCSQSHDIFEFQGESDGESDLLRLRKSQSSNATSKREDKMVNSWGLSSGDTEAFTSSDKRALHARLLDPDAGMLPPTTMCTSFEHSLASGTDTQPTIGLTNHTMPANLMPMNDSRSLRLDHDEDRVPTPTMSSRGQSSDDFAIHTNFTDAAYKRPRLDESILDQGSAEYVELSSSASVISPSKSITITKTVSIDGKDPLLHVPLGNGRSAIDPIVLLPQLPMIDDGGDELSLSMLDPDSENMHGRATTQDQKSKETGTAFTPELGSDDAAIGLPKDQYQPRPSKSRSGLDKEELILPTDHANRPEIATTKKRKFQRRKTTAFQELLPKNEDEDEEMEIIEQPSHDMSKRKALKIFEDSDEEAPEVMESVDEIHLEPNGDPDPKIKPQDQKKQRGRPKKGNNVSHADKIEGTETQTDPGYGTRNEKAEDVPSAKGATIEPLIEAQDERDPGACSPQQSVPPLKSKRGRKKGKASELPAVVSKETVQDSDDELALNEEDLGPSRKVLDEKDANSMLAKAPNGSAISSALATTQQPMPETPRKTASAVEKGPDKHSPISSGKVAYRVGLSKRARIQPLLSIVRKT